MSSSSSSFVDALFLELRAEYMLHFSYSFRLFHSYIVSFHSHHFAAFVRQNRQSEIAIAFYVQHWKTTIGVGVFVC